MKITIGSRGSRLSLIQVEEVATYLKKVEPNIEIKTLKIKTRGDVDRDTPLYKLKEKGVFEKEVNNALLEGLIDAAVHSAKDIPFETVEGKIMLAAIPPRKSRYDILISRGGYGLWSLPSKSIVGTSSLRRMSFLTLYREDILVKNIRGNIDTRIEKLKKGDYDAIILAEAGIERLGIDIGYERLSTEKFVPAAGQGALIVTIREDDKKLKELMNKITDLQTYIEVMFEKMFIGKIGAGCKIPIGVTSFYSRDNGKLTVYVGIVDQKLREMLLIKNIYNLHLGKLPEIEKLLEIVEDVYGEFKESGGLDIIESWRGSR